MCLIRYLPALESQRQQFIRSSADNIRRWTNVWDWSSIWYPILCPPIREVPWRKLWNWQNTAEIWAICRNRYRIFILHRPPSLPVCIIRDWIQEPWQLYMYRRILMKRRCSVHWSSIGIRQIVYWCEKHCWKQEEKIWSDMDQNVC